LKLLNYFIHLQGGSKRWCKIYKFNLFNFLNTEARRGYSKSVPGTFVAFLGWR
jgi:hypothetical protein